MTDPLIERIARAWIHHLGYNDAQIDAARELMLQPNPHLYYVLPAPPVRLEAI